MHAKPIKRQRHGKTQVHIGSQMKNESLNLIVFFLSSLSFSQFIDHSICEWIAQSGINLCKKVTTNGYYSICFFFVFPSALPILRRNLNFQDQLCAFLSLTMVHTCDKSTTAMRSKNEHKRVLTVTSIVNVQWQTVIWNIGRSFNPYGTRR